ncbi:DUF6325 family protein [Cryobacterium sp. CG_9.6]|uniref:DUF6325 family protein n=1 Tax=Cryobacterium sp. CG_9.6 TaxID=2760710 RepID=UPI002476CAF9|nr:DUF6325 family protein [Cryobacterium sp. CG_9.6]MDH6236762.1 putative membrane protein [Cryobacterium sp. CG_9.6]
MLGAIEILVISFPENNFTGTILPELAKIVDNETITIVDGLFVMMDEDGSVAFSEFDELGANSEVASLEKLLGRVDGLISDDDVVELTAGLQPNSSAAILVFEHTWMKPLRDAIVDSGGVLLESIRVPGAAVDAVISSLNDLD